MTNKEWYQSLGCMAIINLIFVMGLLTYIKNTSLANKHSNPDTVRKFKIINIVILSVINISYLLTQFLNPGIRNLSEISN